MLRRATVVIDHATFWNNITSIPVQIKSPGDGQLRMGQKNQEEAGNVKIMMHCPGEMKLKS